MKSSASKYFSTSFSTLSIAMSNAAASWAGVLASNGSSLSILPDILRAYLTLKLPDETIP
jgi:hypothetical protein